MMTKSGVWDSASLLDPTGKTGDSESSQMCSIPKDVNKADVHAQRQQSSVYVRHGNNQVSEEIEVHIQELLRRGWDKSATARALRVQSRGLSFASREQ
jgi:hypothetical protein